MKAEVFRATIFIHGEEIAIFYNIFDKVCYSFPKIGNWCLLWQKNKRSNNTTDCWEAFDYHKRPWLLLDNNLKKQTVMVRPSLYDSPLITILYYYIHVDNRSDQFASKFLSSLNAFNLIQHETLTNMATLSTASHQSSAANWTRLWLLSYIH